VVLDWNGVAITDASLTIEAGAKLNMLPNSEIRVDGAVTVAGTADKPVEIQPTFSSRVQGSWQGFQLSGRGDKTFNHLNLQYAGLAGLENGAIKVDCRVATGTTVQIDNSDISESASWGIFINGDECSTDIGENVRYLNNRLGDSNVP